MKWVGRKMSKTVFRPAPSIMYYSVHGIKHYSLSLHMIMYCTCILACHVPIMDNPENNQHFNVLI